MSLPAIVAATRTGLSEPIRMMDREQATVAISRAISLFCQAFGLEQPAPGALAIAVDMVRNRFAGLGVGEIITAAQLAASGELETGAKFYGKFAMQGFGDILAAYQLERNAARAAIEKEREAAEREAEKQRRDIERQTKYEQDFPGMLAEYKGSMPEIPVHWFDTAVRLGLLEYTDDEKREAWQRADTLAQAELESRLELERKQKNFFTARDIAKQLEANDYDGLRIAYAKKILLYNATR
jgi:hypothetical protein